MSGVELRELVRAVLADIDGYEAANEHTRRQARDEGRRLVRTEQSEVDGRTHVDVYDYDDGTHILGGSWEQVRAHLTANPSMIDVYELVGDDAYEAWDDARQYPPGVPQGLFHAVLEWAEVNVDEARAYAEGNSTA